jgi:hypothetical protein
VSHPWVAPTGYYEWLQQPISNRAQEDARLLRLIRASFMADQGIYGAPRAFRDLREAGETCSKHRVADQEVAISEAARGRSRREAVRFGSAAEDFRLPDECQSRTVDSVLAGQYAGCYSAPTPNRWRRASKGFEMNQLRYFVIAIGLFAFAATTASAAILELGDFDDGGIVWDGSGDVTTMNNTFPPTETSTFADIGLDPALWVGRLSVASGPFVSPVTLNKFGLIVSLVAGECVSCDTLSDALALFDINTAVDETERDDGEEGDLDVPLVVHTAFFQGVELPVMLTGGERLEFQLSAVDQDALRALLGTYHPAMLRVGLAADTFYESSFQGDRMPRLTFTVRAVPEPALLALLGLAIPAVASRRRRRAPIQSLSTRR